MPLAKTKAAETKDILNYVVEVMQRRGQEVTTQRTLIEAGQTLLAYQSQQSQLPRRLTLAQSHTMFATFKRYVALAKKAGIADLPKLHTFGHMTHRWLIEITQHVHS